MQNLDLFYTTSDFDR